MDSFQLLDLLESRLAFDVFRFGTAIIDYTSLSSFNSDLRSANGFFRGVSSPVCLSHEHWLKFKLHPHTGTLALAAGAANASHGHVEQDVVLNHSGKV